ncbi:MAG TPA: FAD-dependent monooxygenase [Burkholderiales bacterium]|nr:FAD-dependent monooxygenase [Burkholderiales bacterium]
MAANNRRVIIIGGSLAGLLAGNMFQRLGWQVDVYERTPGVLEGRGAGITVLPGLVEGFRAAGVAESELGETLGIDLPRRAALDRAGNVLAQREFSQVMTSWSKLYELLKAVFPSQHYHRGKSAERIEQDAHRVTAVFADGSRASGDLLIGADGLRSTVRAQFLPDLKPHYPGYIAWRCLAEEQDLSQRTREEMFDRYTLCTPPGEQAIGYPVPGAEQSVARGRRQYNVVWYHPVREDDLRDMQTDDAGRYHAGGIAPSLLRAQIKREMATRAERLLAPQFAEAIQLAKLQFFQPIVDLESPRVVFGRAVLVGDAAFVARPHTAMGVPKGAKDVIALVQAVQRGGDDFLGALPAYEAERLRIASKIVARGRMLGAYMEAQLKSDAERAAAEAKRNPAEVMMETAAPVDYENWEMETPAAARL